MEVTMSVPMLTKMHMNGYDVLSVNNGPWRVCTKGDRLGALAAERKHWPMRLRFPPTEPGRAKRRVATNQKARNQTNSTLEAPVRRGFVAGRESVTAATHPARGRGVLSGFLLGTTPLRTGHETFVVDLARAIEADIVRLLMAGLDQLVVKAGTRFHRALRYR